MSTAIQWTDVTDNIIVGELGGWWCRKVSEECSNCYAEGLNGSNYFGGNHLKYSGQPPKLKLRTDLIDGWARQRNPKKHFVASMTDIFGDWVPVTWAFQFLDGMAAAPKQTFQLLTKRPEIALAYTNQWLAERNRWMLPENIWMGVSAGKQKYFDERAPILMQIRAAIRWMSLEPLLGPIDMRGSDAQSSALDAFRTDPKLDWIVTGGESGAKARECHLEWLHSIVQQCAVTGLHCFVKQVGKLAMCDNANMFDFPDDAALVGEGEGFAACQLVTKHPKGGDMAEWPDQIQVRQFPRV
jgi:protein gp37